MPSLHRSASRISPSRESEQLLKYTQNCIAVMASCCLPPAAPCHQGRAVTDLPSLLALTDPYFSCHLSNSCRTQALEVSHSSLPVMGFPVHLKSPPSEVYLRRQSLPHVICLKVCTAVAFKDIEAIDNGDSYADI